MTTPPPTTGTALVAEHVTKRFGGLLAVNDISLTVDEREIVGLIGPNGAGKTTFFNCLTGMISPTSGSITYRGQRLHGRPEKITGDGVARTFQNIRLFANLTVLENVLVGRHLQLKQGLFSAIFRGPGYHRGELAAGERARELIAFVGLTKLTDEVAKNLPYGDQRRLEIARALATDPGLILLDEPTAGMNPQETRATMELVRKIRADGLAVVVIEHDMRFIFSLCDRVAVLVQGAILVQGDPATVQADHRVIEAYLGTAVEESA